MNLALTRANTLPVASKFFEHFILISDAMTYRSGEDNIKSLWNEDDQ